MIIGDKSPSSTIYAVRKPASVEQIVGNIDINGTLLVISNTRVSFGYQKLKCDEIVGIRYGIFKNYVNGIRTSRSYAVWLSDRSSTVLIECASAFASSATVEARYQATLSALYPAVIVPLLESFLGKSQRWPWISDCDYYIRQTWSTPFKFIWSSSEGVAQRLGIDGWRKVRGRT